MRFTSLALLGAAIGSAVASPVESRGVAKARAVYKRHFPNAQLAKRNNGGGGSGITDNVRRRSGRLALTSQDILNFALNLEYLEAQFYHIAAFGTQLSQDLLSGTGNRGYVQVRLVSVQGPLTAQNNAGSQVPFNSSLIRQYAISVACVVALARPADRAATMR